VWGGGGGGSVAEPKILLSAPALLVSSFEVLDVLF
jgi:hypothetical protein